MNADQLKSNLDKLPELCFVLNEGGEPVIVFAGKTGFYAVDPDKYPQSVTAPQDFVTQMNNKLEVTPAQRNALEFGSMFGFDTPGANPDADINQRAA